MQILEAEYISKSFGNTRAVRDVSFAVERGEIFGLLGPNGAGKTTTLRLILDIFKPDSGTVSILGGPMTEEKKERIGYMPEERGLYPDMTVERCLVYFGMLKGLSAAEARRQVGTYLERFGLGVHQGKKVKDLSKGMQQKAQIIAAITHRPELLIVDEPFIGLDPINTQMVKDLICELRDEGATIVMSTHQMRQVEELCDRILLMDEGRDVLYGHLEQIRRQYSGHAVLVRVAGELPVLAGVERAAPQNDAIKLTLAKGTSPQAVLQALIAENAVVEKFEIAIPTVDEIFIRAVQQGGA